MLKKKKKKQGMSENATDFSEKTTKIKNVIQKYFERI